MNEIKKHLMDAISEDLSRVIAQSKTETPLPWPRMVVDDGTGGTFLLTFVGSKESTLYASVSINRQSGITWRRLVEQHISNNERVFVALTPNEGEETFSYNPFVIAETDEQKALFASLPPPILPED